MELVRGKQGQGHVLIELRLWEELRRERDVQRAQRGKPMRVRAMVRWSPVLMLVTVMVLRRWKAVLVPMVAGRRRRVSGRSARGLVMHGTVARGSDGCFQLPSRSSDEERETQHASKTAKPHGQHIWTGQASGLRSTCPARWFALFARVMVGPMSSPRLIASQS